jgi:hypothetical protein
MKWFLLIITVFSLSSCVLQREYPKDWSPIAVPNDNLCPSITGKYHDREDTTSWVSTSLSNLLTGIYPHLSKERGTLYVSLTQKEGNTVEIAVWLDDTMLYTRLLSYQRCEGGFLVVPTGLAQEPPRRGLGPFREKEGALGPEWNWGDIRLGRAGDDLVIRKEGKSISGLFFLPFYSASTSWHRFPIKAE